jgi:glycosyltransferase involved in cell wall biosynthesis
MSSAQLLRILVVTRSYPAPGDLYQYPFVHRRVLAYANHGHEVAVFRPADQPALSEHRIDGVTCRSGSPEALAAFAADWRPDVVAAHGFSETQWPALAPLAERTPIRAWLHGSEIPEFARRKAEWDLAGEERAAALEVIERRRRFWREFLVAPPARFGLVFVSHAAVDLFRHDLPDAPGAPTVIPNPIDTALFRYGPKPAAQRFHVLMLRPFDSRGYGNDLAVSAILHLSEWAGFDRLRFTILGDGPLMDRTLAPLRHLRNVAVERGFVTQARIAELHREHGIFLVPTRIDTQGVSRDEAMSSGLVPVTNAIPAVREFVDRECGELAPPEDAGALASGIRRMAEEAALFEARSAAAAAHVRRRSAAATVAPRELALLRSAADA